MPAVSFDLGLWDADRPPEVAEAKRRFDQLRRGDDPTHAPSPRITAFTDECEQRWPEEGGGPLSATRTPSGLLAAIQPEEAAALYGELAEMAERHGVVLYDPQSGVVKIPSRLSFDAQPPPPKGRRFGRKV